MQRVFSHRALSVVVCLVTVVCQTSQQVSAISQGQKNLFLTGLGYTNAEDDVVGCGTTNAVSVDLPATIPAGYATLFKQAAGAYKTNPQFLAALFLNEHSNTWLPFTGPWASSPVGASGPFQFMPGTWSAYKVDGNNDGVADIQNIYDATYSAANYLNKSGISEKTPLGDLVSPFTPGTFVYFSAVYNWGGGNVQRKTTASSPLSAAPKETENYMTNTYQLISSAFTKGSDQNGPVVDQSNGQTASVSGGSGAAGVGCSSGVVAGNIAKTAVGLAWDTSGHGYLEADARPEYRNIMPTANGATLQFPYSDCGVFVSTVMISSGADPDYPKRFTPTQKKYLETSTKYQQITSRNTADLQAGDIFVNSHHTYLYVGPQSGGYSIVAASLHTEGLNGHVPEAGGNPYFFQNGTSGEPFEIFRFKG